MTSHCRTVAVTLLVSMSGCIAADSPVRVERVLMYSLDAPGDG